MAATVGINTACGADFGTRYTQTFAIEDVPHLAFLRNAEKYAAIETDPATGETTFARNEDVCRTWTMPSIIAGRDVDMLVAVVADGHASATMPSGEAVGGYEIARNSVDVVEENLHKMAHGGHKVETSDIPRILNQIFALAHEEAVRATLSHFIKLPASQDFIHRESQGVGMMSGMIPLDRALPPTPYKGSWGDIDIAARSRGGKNIGAVAMCIVPSSDDETADRLADYGCTLTVVMVSPKNPHDDADTGLVITANVGDSEAHLYRGNAHHATLTTQHNVGNPKERVRMRRYGVTVAPKSPYFHAPDIERSLMISRCIGHAVLQHFGFLYQPHVSFHPVQAGDTIVVATDGVWDFIDPAIIAPANFNGVDDVSTRLADIIKKFPRRDNAAWCVFKLQ